MEGPRGSRGEARPSEGGEVFSFLQQPRIRDITGIRIHQLTLPAALPLASKLVTATDSATPPPDDDSYFASGPDHSPGSLSSPSSSVLTFPTHHRTSSASHHPSRRDRRMSITEEGLGHGRKRSESSSTVVAPPLPPPASPRILRVTRPRAPTLAGEAIESGHAFGREKDESVKVEDAGALGEAVEHPRRLARCFVVLQLPVKKAQRGEGYPSVPLPKRSQSDEHAPRVSSTHAGSPTPDGHKPTLRIDSRTSSSSSLRSPPPASPVRPRLLSSSSSRSSLSRLREVGETPTRKRTTSLTIPVSPLSPSPKRNLLTTRSYSARRPIPSAPSSPRHPPSSPPPPFYLSPIHRASTHPRFLHLSPTDDFAPWLTVEEVASHVFTLEVWAEDEQGSWEMVKGIGGEVDLRLLKRMPEEKENQVGFELEGEKGVFWLPPRPDIAIHDGQGDSKLSSGDKLGAETEQRVTKPMSDRGVVERSLRETRMKRPTPLGALHQLVNLQAVIADTQRSIDEVRSKIDGMLLGDVDRRGASRDVEERKGRVDDLRESCVAVEKVMGDRQSGLTRHRQSLAERRATLDEAREGDDARREQAADLQESIDSVDLARASLQPAIHHWQTHHVQSLDALFPILPLSPSILLYSILGVPLPIPLGPKDPAPPLSVRLPEGMGKVDERTTAAALGYVAMVVQVLAGLGGKHEGGVPYPVTCAGSRSLVRDVVSVMQGPRSFPLYAKGVERYRYEYAVFLLNKDIEMLMQQAQIRLLDLRHTLPNLKNLLLTLSSPYAPSSLHHHHNPFASPRTAASSRQTSSTYNWASPRQLGSPASSVTGGSPGSSKASPMRGRPRRSMLSRPSLSVGQSLSDDEGEEAASGEDAEGSGDEEKMSSVQASDSLSRPVIASP